MTAPILYAADVTPLQDPELFGLAYAAASPARREKTDRYCFMKDRQLSLGAETLLRYALRGAGLDPASVRVERGAGSKPYLRDGGPFFNLSHSGIWSVCALAESEVGCDVEQIEPIDLKLARRFLPEEYADILAQPEGEEQLELFYRYWTLKESFMKATGLGMRLPLNAFHIVRGEKISVRQNVDGREYGFREFTGLAGYKCAVCCAGGRADICSDGSDICSGGSDICSDGSDICSGGCADSRSGGSDIRSGGSDICSGAELRVLDIEYILSGETRP